MKKELTPDKLADAQAIITGIIESIPGALIILDNDWHITLLNDEAKNFFKPDKTSIIGKPLIEVYPKELGYLLSPDSIKKILNDKEKTQVIYSNNLSKWYSITVHPLNPGIIVRLDDITSQMLTSRLLRLNQFSVSHFKDMVFWVKPSGHIINVNESTTVTAGYKKDELLKMKIMDIFPSFSQSRWNSHVIEMRQSGSMIFESELLAKDLRIVPVEITCNYFNYRNDEYFVSVVRDITERKKQENALKVSKAEADLYLDLLSHDINNINQITLGYLELAEETLKLDDDSKELINKPIDAIQSCVNLIENVGKLRKQKNGALKLETVDLGDILTELKDRYSGNGSRQVTIDFNHKETCPIVANGLIIDVFSNIIINAIKHSISDRVEINIGLIHEGTHCIAYVEDKGPGISDDEKLKIFKKFERGSTRVHGKGIGLYLVRTLVEDFKGKVWVEDRVKGDHTKGSRFIIRLPIAKNNGPAYE